MESNVTIWAVSEPEHSYPELATHGSVISIFSPGAAPVTVKTPLDGPVTVSVVPGVVKSAAVGVPIVAPTVEVVNVAPLEVAVNESIEVDPAAKVVTVVVVEPVPA
jgi:hypothetical protein